MTLTPQQRVAAFEIEWSMRYFLLIGVDTPEAEITRHKREIMHNYQVTDEDLQAFGEKK